MRFLHRRRQSREQQITELYEARIADLKEAYEKRHAESMRVVKALAEQVEFLRAKHYGPSPQLHSAPLVSDTPVKARPERDFAPVVHSRFFLSEDEEDVLALRDGGHLDPIEANQALETLRAAVGGVPITVDPS